MSNTTNDYDVFIKRFIQVSSYFPIATVSVGTLGNLLAFFIIILSSQLRKLTPIIYFAFLCIINIFSLIHWNLDYHFLIINYKWTMVDFSMITCKLLTFLQYTSFQVIGLINCLMCVDFYYSLGLKTNPFRLGKMNKIFTTRVSAVGWCTLVIIFMSLLNLHFLALNGHWPQKDVVHNITLINQNGTVLNKLIDVKKDVAQFKCYVYPFSNSKLLLDIWDHIVNIFYNYIPILIILTFDFLILVRLIKMNKASSFTISTHDLEQQHNDSLNSLNETINHDETKRLGLAVLFWSLLFLAFTAPTQIMYTFWFHVDTTQRTKLISIIMDTLLYIQHGSIFFVLFLTSSLFRKETFHSLFRCCLSRKSPTKMNRNRHVAKI